jgi:hypothetical protein
MYTEKGVVRKESFRTPENVHCAEQTLIQRKRHTLPFIGFNIPFIAMPQLHFFQGYLLKYLMDLVSIIYYLMLLVVL